MTKRSFIPIILNFSFIFLICVFAVVRYLNNYMLVKGVINFDIIVIGLYLLWLLAEFGVTRSEISKGGRTADFGTCEIYALGRALTFLSALWFPSIWIRINPMALLGIFVFVAGFSFRLWAIHTLGRYYSHIVRKVKRHKIIDSGPYRIVRHPAYTGMIFAHVGILLYFFNWITLLILMFILVPAIIVRILIEEKTLFEITGYRKFAQGRKKILPFIW